MYSINKYLCEILFFISFFISSWCCQLQNHFNWSFKFTWLLLLFFPYLFIFDTQMMQFNFVMQNFFYHNEVSQRFFTTSLLDWTRRTERWLTLELKKNLKNKKKKSWNVWYLLSLFSFSLVYKQNEKWFNFADVCKCRVCTVFISCVCGNRSGDNKIRRYFAYFGNFYLVCWSLLKFFTCYLQRNWIKSLMIRIPEYLHSHRGYHEIV